MRARAGIGMWRWGGYRRRRGRGGETEVEDVLEDRSRLRSGVRERRHGGEERAILGGDRYVLSWSFGTDTDLYVWP